MDLQQQVLDLLSPLRAKLFEFTLLPEKDLVLPRFNKANVLRGAFGYECRRLVCGNHFQDDCKDCARLQSCPYAVIFEPAPHSGSTQLRNYQDVPRAYLFRVQPDSKVVYTSSAPFHFQLLLVGSVIDAFPYFIVVFRELGRLGMGVNRGKFQILSVDALDPVENGRVRIYSSADNLVRQAPVELGLGQISKRLRGLATESLTLEFVTPVKLIFREEEVQRPHFQHIFKRLRDRVSSLLYFHCAVEPSSEQRDLYRLLGELSEKVEVTDTGLQRQENFRVTRRKESHPLSGFTGRISFSGDLRPFLPFLAAGEWVGVGKNTVFGGGWFKILPGQESVNESRTRI